VILVLATTRPDTFRVERSIAIRALPDSIWPFLDDFHRWRAWSPWEGMDPAMTRTYSGADSGVGATYEWAGNRKVGSGRMEITEARPTFFVTIALDFRTPFESHNTARLALHAAADSTIVTWTMTGPNGYFAKVMSIFVSMDRLVGKDFEAGLANLKSVVEH
jgi:hypothetical protein